MDEEGLERAVVLDFKWLLKSRTFHQPKWQKWQKSSWGKSNVAVETRGELTGGSECRSDAGDGAGESYMEKLIGHERSHMGKSSHSRSLSPFRSASKYDIEYLLTVNIEETHKMKRMQPCLASLPC